LGDLGRVLISGANGHLGRRIIARLRSGSPATPVRALVRREGAAETLRALPEAVRPEIVVADYADARGLARACEGCRSLVHLVGILKETSTTRYSQAHETTTSALARAAASAGQERIVYLSILGTDAESHNACLRSKGRAEDILLKGAVPTTVLRVPMVLGPGDIASEALRRQTRAKRLPLVRGGATKEQPIFADDVVEAIVSSLARPELAGERLDLAGPESLSHRELVQRAASLAGTSPRIVSVPYGVVRTLARILGRLLANPPVTAAMLDVLEHDDDIDPQPAASRLGIRLTPLDETLRICLAAPGEDS
jgi:uncharacterized protein YbjT (DUF2867 family)